ncbi:MAG: TetR/AcrR family transcriptional regulator [Chloroflexi bacterium]|nr:MAG: TetR/AcrR family transcriptional regulator [Chloroflexota bacterium]
MEQSSDEPVAGRKRGPRAGTSREAIIEGAWALAMREGFEALTMRAVASELGIGAMTPYTYFRAREELIAALLDEVLGTIPLELPEAAWAVRLEALVRAHHDALLRFPSAIPHLLSTPMTGPKAAVFAEVLMQVLHDGGLVAEDVVGGFFALAGMNYGFASFESRRMNAPPEGAAQTRATLLTLPPEQFPLTIEVATQLANFARTGADYDFALSSMIAGLSARATSN